MITECQYRKRISKVSTCFGGLRGKENISKEKAAKAGRQYLDWVLKDSRVQWRLQRAFMEPEIERQDLNDNSVLVGDRVWEMTTIELRDVIEKHNLEAVRKKACRMKRRLDKFEKGELAEREKNQLAENFQELNRVINRQRVVRYLPDRLMRPFSLRTH